MHISTVLTLVAFTWVRVATSSPWPAESKSVVHSELALSADSGCNSIGPFNSTSDVWFILKSCTPGSTMTCQATDQTGCLLGDAAHILILEVDDPNEEFTVAASTETNTLRFVCPSIGQIRCQVSLRSKKFGPDYSLRGEQFSVSVLLPTRLTACASLLREDCEKISNGSTSCRETHS
ncbi:hypothetical protein C2E23DRAFT_740809 [Lenzites betulinus]|nr:hypothetical protein C2E23DRAFT_740809 [Lenzites betulinus]